MYPHNPLNRNPYKIMKPKSVTDLNCGAFISGFGD